MRAVNQTINTGIITHTSPAAGVRMIVATHIHASLWNLCPGTDSILHHLPEARDVVGIAWKATREANHRDRASRRRRASRSGWLTLRGAHIATETKLCVMILHVRKQETEKQKKNTAEMLEV